MENTEPNVRDEVKHKSNEFVGVVLAKYPDVVKNKKPPKQLLDVRIFGHPHRQVIYGTPAKNWEVVRTEKETFE